MKQINLNKLYLIGFALILISFLELNLVSAYDSHKQNTDLTFTINSNNGTSCNITVADTPNGNITINQKASRFSQTFTFYLNNSNFITLGDYCYNLECTDGISIESGSRCFTLTPSGNNGTNNLVFIIFVIIMVYAIAFIGFFGKNEIVTILGGMFMIGLGIYLVNNGIIVYRDWITNYFSYITIGIGSFFSLFTTIELINSNR